MKYFEQEWSSCRYDPEWRRYRWCTCDFFYFVQGSQIICVLSPLFACCGLAEHANKLIETASASFLAVNRRHIWASAMFCVDVYMRLALALYSALFSPNIKCIKRYAVESVPNHYKAISLKAAFFFSIQMLATQLLSSWEIVTRWQGQHEV